MTHIRDSSIAHPELLLQWNGRIQDQVTVASTAHFLTTMIAKQSRARKSRAHPLEVANNGRFLLAAVSPPYTHINVITHFRIRRQVYAEGVLPTRRTHCAIVRRVSDSCRVLHTRFCAPGIVQH